MSKNARLFLVAFIIFGSSVENFFGQRRKTPPELRGSVVQRVEQNTRAESFGVGQIADDRELAAMVQDNILVELPSGSHYFIDRGTKTKPWKITRRVNNKKVGISCDPKPNEVFVYPWVKEYLDKLAADYFLKFKKKFKITSGARSLEEHILMRTRGTCYYELAAALAGNPLEETLHARGIAIDISLKGMKASEIRWMRERLIADKTKGVEFEIDPIEESFCYHIVVFPKTTETQTTPP